MPRIEGHAVPRLEDGCMKSLFIATFTRCVLHASRRCFKSKCGFGDAAYYWFGGMPCLTVVTMSVASSAFLASKSYRLDSLSRYITNYIVVSQSQRTKSRGKSYLYTLNCEGCLLDSLHPITLLKCTVVVLLLLSVTTLPFEDGTM